MDKIETEHDAKYLKSSQPRPSKKKYGIEKKHNLSDKSGVGPDTSYAKSFTQYLGFNCSAD